MARFRFRLERVLEQRRREERDEQIAVGAIQQERRRIEAKIREQQRLIDGAKQGVRNALSIGAVDTRSARAEASASLRYVLRVQRLAFELAGVHSRLEAAQERLREAMKRRKAVELLRERQYEQWRAEQERREHRELDDIGMGGWIRQKADSVEMNT